MLFGHLGKPLPLILAMGVSLWSLSGEGRAAIIEPGATQSQLQPLASQSLLVDVVLRGEQGVAVGERGHLLTSGPQGWQQQQVPLDTLLTKVYFSDASHGWSVGHDASIIATTDGGKSWSLQHHQPSMDRPLFDVYFKDNQQGVAIGAYGLFLRTTDGGTTWSSNFLSSLLHVDDQEYLAELKESSMEDYLYEQSSILPHFNRIVPLSGDRLLLVGELGLMAISNDFGHSWERLEEIYPGSFFAALETTQGRILVGGLRGNVFASDDNGVSWSNVVLPQNATINHIYQDAEGDIYLASTNGAVMRSRDNGQSFKVIHRLKGQAVVSVLRMGDTLWLASSKGMQGIDLAAISE